MAQNARELDVQHGTRLWAQYQHLVPNREKPTEGALTVLGGLVLLLKAGFIFNMATDVLLQVEHVLSDVNKAFLEKYQAAMKIFGTAHELLDLFRTTPDQLRWEDVSGSEYLRMTTHLPSIARSRSPSGAAWATKGNEHRFVKSVLQSSLFTRGFDSLQAAARKYFPAGLGEHASPFLNSETLRCDLLTFNLFVQAANVPQSKFSLSSQEIYSCFVGLEGAGEAILRMNKALVALDPGAKKWLEELEEKVVDCRTTALNAVSQASSSQAVAREARAQVEEVRARCVLPDDQLIVSRYMEGAGMQHGALSAMEARLLFGALVASEIAQRGLSETVSRETFSETGEGSDLRRHVYRRSAHLPIFDFVRLSLWDEAVRREEARLNEQGDAVHRGAEFRRMYYAAVRERQLSELETQNDVKRFARMERYFRMAVHSVSERRNARPEPLGQRDRQGHAHEFRWTRAHLPIFQEAFASTLAREQRVRTGTRSPRL